MKYDRVSKQKKVLSDKELYRKFSRLWNFKRSIQSSPHYVKQFGEYIFKTFIRKGNMRRFVRQFIHCIHSSRSDYYVYNFIIQEIRKQGITINHLVTNESKYYLYYINKKISKLNKFKHMMKIDTDNPKILDIGTERLEFLDGLQSNFNIDKYNINGINIDDGFCHYDDAFTENISDSRFSFYDGTSIKFQDDYYNVITMFSVIHHMTSNDFNKLSQELFRVCMKGGYLFIKDVDLNQYYAKYTFIIQHDLYNGGIIMPGSGCCINDKVSKANTIQVLTDAGFNIVSTESINNFNSSYFILAKKPEA